MKVQEFSDGILAETEKVIVGKHDRLKLIMAAVLSDGHVLLNDLPGSGKTTLVKALSKALGCGYKRIQFVPDLMPADILGAKVFNQKTGDFEYMEGPVRTNILLADEINRAIPRTQSALLEAMEEKQISVDGVPSPLPEPFIVLATQNPVEMESTFPLPAAQLDRFFICISLGYLDEAGEIDMLMRSENGDRLGSVEVKASPELLLEMQKQAAAVRAGGDITTYIIRLVQATRSNADLRLGASPRASIALLKGAKAWAAMSGRDYVVPDDVKTLAPYILTHRVVLTGEAAFAGRTEEMIISEILRNTPVPPDRAEALLGKN